MRSQTSLSCEVLRVLAVRGVERQHAPAFPWALVSSRREDSCGWRLLRADMWTVAAPGELIESGVDREETSTAIAS